MSDTTKRGIIKTSWLFESIGCCGGGASPVIRRISEAEWTRIKGRCYQLPVESMASGPAEMRRKYPEDLKKYNLIEDQFKDEIKQINEVLSQFSGRGYEWLMALHLHLEKVTARYKEERLVWTVAFLQEEASSRLHVFLILPRLSDEKEDPVVCDSVTGWKEVDRDYRPWKNSDCCRTHTDSLPQIEYADIPYIDKRVYDLHIVNKRNCCDGSTWGLQEDYTFNAFRRKMPDPTLCPGAFTEDSWDALIRRINATVNENNCKSNLLFQLVAFPLCCLSLCVVNCCVSPRIELQWVDPLRSLFKEENKLLNDKGVSLNIAWVKHQLGGDYALRVYLLLPGPEFKETKEDNDISETKKQEVVIKYQRKIDNPTLTGCWPPAAGDGCITVYPSNCWIHQAKVPRMSLDTYQETKDRMYQLLPVVPDGLWVPTGFYRPKPAASVTTAFTDVEWSEQLRKINAVVKANMYSAECIDKCMWAGMCTFGLTCCWTDNRQYDWMEPMAEHFAKENVLLSDKQVSWHINWVKFEEGSGGTRNRKKGPNLRIPGDYMAKIYLLLPSKKKEEKESNKEEVTPTSTTTTSSAPDPDE